MENLIAVSNKLVEVNNKLTEVTEQRDRLAVALERCLDNSWDGPMPDYARRSANKALTTVKGGSDE